MTVKEYTLTDLEAKINNISSISMFLRTESCPKDISISLQDHMQEEIENLQGILSFMQIYPQIINKESSTDSVSNPH
ncbi:MULTISPECIES: RstC protein [Aliivibrio]|uniref:RstC protein n=1 Tax=Aliivibrio finisterrensis TaxID=511998 RepID=A0A4Q5KY76_9GAMM|nr:MULTISPECIES: RstC protein [Aliivibrio]MDD9180725.1 RstC protein [Aliivibrio sp. A6]RYU49578.1 RstC protein [Aliivibrio finisterrensis]RYU49582.1 RstC protein [Aliivibrio finisterrensis]RYU53311.1 RstC protein [Aliivibrio finisterrensis]RYU53315.1 RstC protein [Aliivibrio finisterrensis]